MELQELRAAFRTETGDKREPYLFDDDDLDLWFNEATKEAALRARLIYEATNTDICQIAVTAGTTTYSVHTSLYEIVRARFQATGSDDWTYLDIRSREELDRIRPLWRETEEKVRDLIQDEKTLTFGCIPSESGTLKLEGYRLPTSTLEDDDSVPEIHSRHHRNLVDWVLFRAYSNPDAETNDPKRAEEAERRFIKYFGLRPDAQARSLTRHDVHHRNQLW